MSRGLRVFFCLCALAVAAAHSQNRKVLDLNGLPLVVDDTFPADAYVRQQARFWVEIYWHTSADEGWLHDPMYPSILFRKVAAPAAEGRRSVQTALRSLQADLRALEHRDTTQWTAEQRRLHALIPPEWDSTAIELCAQRVRFQRGLRDRFVQGLERSYRYLPLIDSIFAAAGVPGRLQYLPHVESSFHPDAYSRVGAAGMWQFMKSTGRKFLKVGYYIDERRDPLVSTAAAAQMLSRCYGIVKNWPLAVMAYNHGPEGVAKAVAVTHTTDMGTILQSYYSNTFGFASRNFYAEFLAASSLAMLADSLFPHLQKWTPLAFQIWTPSKPVSTRAVADGAGLSLADLEQFNLALRPSIFRNGAWLPKGYHLRLPLHIDTTALAAHLAAARLALAARKPVTPPATTVADKARAQPTLAAAAPPAAPVKRQTYLRPSTPSSPALVPRYASQSEALAPPAPPPPAPSPPPPPPPVPPSEIDVDSAFALQLSDWETVAHPWDRFDPTVYHLEHQYADGVLTVRVGPEETLSHFSDWSGLYGAEIRRENHLRRHDFHIGRVLHLRMDSAAAAVFLRRREEYFRGREEDFYSRYHVDSLEPLVVTRGLNIWSFAQDHDIPYWLFLKHNPGRALDSLMPGDTLMLPVIVEGWRHWGFTRYANTRDYLNGVRQYVAQAGAAP